MFQRLQKLWAPRNQGNFNRARKSALRVERLDDRLVPAFFGSATELGLGAPTTDVATGDFDGDGRQDFVTLNAGSSSIGVPAKVAVLLNSGNSFGFTPDSPIVIGDARTIVTGDFNSDGKADFASAVFAGSPGNVVRVFLATDLRFSEASGSPNAVGNQPNKIATADFNNDAILDLITANEADENVSVLLGTGAGSFGSAINSPLATSDVVTSLSIADFNRDGIKDVAVTHASSGLLDVLVGDGAGGFASSNGIATGMDVVTAGDVNGEGDADLVVGTGNTTRILLGNGFVGFDELPSSSLSGSGLVMQLRDLNADGTLDIVRADNTANLSVFLGFGDGKFIAAPGSPFALAGVASALAAADFDGNGRMDVVATHMNVESVEVLMATAPAAGDFFENDNTADQANPIDSGGLIQRHSIHVPKDVDWVRFTLSAAANVTIETDGVAKGDTWMKLFRENGRQIDFNDNAGNGSYSKIVRSGNARFLPAGVYRVKVGEKGQNNTIADYTIQVTATPALGEITGDAVRSIGTVPVAIRPLNPSRIRVIDPNRVTWLVIHGRTEEPTTEAPHILRLSKAIDRFSPNDQVLTLDWRQGAKGVSESDFTGEDWITPVAKWAAEELGKIGFGSLGRNTRLNLVGHSWGTYVADELAERISGGVNSIIALDPPINVPPPFGGSFNPEAPGEINFGAHSAISWAFSSTTGAFLVDSPITSNTADETYNVIGTDHVPIVSVFSFLLEQPGRAISRTFRLGRILTAQPPSWLEANRYNRTGILGNADHADDDEFRFEAVLTAGSSGLTPAKLTYFDAIRKREVTIRV